MPDPIDTLAEPVQRTRAALEAARRDGPPEGVNVGWGDLEAVLDLADAAINVHRAASQLIRPGRLLIRGENVECDTTPDPEYLDMPEGVETAFVPDYDPQFGGEF